MYSHRHLLFVSLCRCGQPHGNRNFLMKLSCLICCQRRAERFACNERLIARISLQMTTARASASALCPTRRCRGPGPGRPRARRYDCPVRQAEEVRLRQRHGANQHGDPVLERDNRVSIGTTFSLENRARHAFVENFTGRLRDECLNETLLSSPSEARTGLTAWRDDYNCVRPHSALANRTPQEFRDHHLPLAIIQTIVMIVRLLRKPRG